VATTRARLTEDEQRSWNQFVGEGIAHSIEGLSEMVGPEVSLKSHVEPSQEHEECGASCRASV